MLKVFPAYPVLDKLCLMLPCHHQNDFCIKMGSDESHFNGSFIVTGMLSSVSTDHNFWREGGPNVLLSWFNLLT